MYFSLSHSTCVSHVKFGQKMIDRADVGEYFGMCMAHEPDVPLRDSFPGGWKGIGENALDFV